VGRALARHLLPADAARRTHLAHEGTTVLDFSAPTTALGPALAGGRRPRSGRARVLAASAVLAVLAVGTTACTHQAGSAAVIGDQRITTQQVDDAVTGIQQGNPQLSQGDGLSRTVLFYLMIAPWVSSAAESKGVAVSDDEAKAVLSGTRDPDPDAVRVIRTFLALQKLQADPNALTQIQKDVVAAHPQVNPRYGHFDGKTMNVDDVTPNWLAAPKATPTQTAPAP